jgi:predicted MFS family arabinose efflux permease
MASLARVFGPAMGGFLYGHMGQRSPYWAAATGMALALLIALTLPTKTPEAPAEL